MGKRMRPAEAPHPCGAPWPELQRNQPVSLVNERGRRLSGRLDAITEDRSTIWIHLEGGMGRQLIHQADGYALEDGPDRPAS